MSDLPAYLQPRRRRQAPRLTRTLATISVAIAVSMLVPFVVISIVGLALFFLRLIVEGRL